MHATVRPLSPVWDCPRFGVAVLTTHRSRSATCHLAEVTFPLYPSQLRLVLDLVVYTISRSRYQLQGEILTNKKHLKNVGPIRHCEPPLYCHLPGVAAVARQL